MADEFEGLRSTEMTAVEFALLSHVRELLQQHAEGSPDGEPVFIDTASIIEMIEWQLSEGEIATDSDGWAKPAHRLNDRQRHIVETGLDELEDAGLIEEFFTGGMREWVLTDKGETAYQVALAKQQSGGRRMN